MIGRLLSLVNRDTCLTVLIGYRKEVGVACRVTWHVDACLSGDVVRSFRLHDIIALCWIFKLLSYVKEATIGFMIG